MTVVCKMFADAAVTPFYGAKRKEENENVRKTAYLFAHTVPTLFRRNKYCMIKSRIKEKGGSEMMKFDNAKYRTVLNLIKKTGEFKGKAVPSKARLHEMIGDALGISHNTVKDWERATSNGPDPRIPGLLEQLEAYLELPEGGLRERTAEPIKLNEEERKIMNTTTDFQKQQIMECYERLRKFVSDMDIEDENVYYDIRNMIEVKKIALPTAVYKAMMNFMDQVVEPYVFEDTTEIFSEEEAKRNEKGIVEIKSEQAFQKLMVRFMEKLSELDAKIETFAESELKPYLER